MSSTTAPATTTDDAPVTGYGFRTVTTATPDTHPTIMAATDGPTDPPTDGPVVAVADDTPDASLIANEVRSFIARFWAAPTAASLDLIVLWVLGTHVRGRGAAPFLMESYPLLMLGSTGPASGKSTALRLISELSSRGEMVIDPTAPSLLNLVEESYATACIDEMDTLLGNGAGSRNLRAHLLTSYTAGGTITRAASGTVRKVDVHYPVALAGMLRTWATHPNLNALRTRTLCIHCRPIVAGPDAPEITRFRPRHRTMAASYREVLSMWGLAEGPRVAVTAEHITLPEEIVNRDAELWEPIMAVAEVLGGDWPDRARAACAEITSGAPGEEDAPRTPVEWLLRDLSHVWTPGAARMSSADIVSGLMALPESPWRRWLDANPDNPAVSGGKQLAAMLAERDVRPRVMKISGVAVRGFALTDLMAAGMSAPVVVADDGSISATDDETGTTVTTDADGAVTVTPAAKRPRRRNPGPKRAPGGPATPVTSV